MKHLLILQTGAGGGHFSITRAIRQGLERLKAPLRISTENMLPKQVEDLYAVAQKPGFVEFYHLFYKLTDNPYGSQLSSQINLLVQKDYFRAFLEQHQPDAILTNTQLGTREIPLLLREIERETGKKIPFLVFVPDPFTPHRLCFSKKADLTFVPTIRTFQLALRHGLDSRRIVLSGHPIREEFYRQPRSLAEHRAGLALDPDRFTILFGASGNGSERIYEIISRLCKKSRHSIQALMVTGKNTQLRERLERVNFPDNIDARIFGYIDDAQLLADLFHASQLIVAKAGPNAVLEAVAAGKPFIATHFIKGQETGNKNYIISTGIGFYEPKPKRVERLIRNIGNDPAILELMRTRIDREKAKHQHASAIIAEHVIRLLS